MRKISLFLVFFFIFNTFSSANDSGSEFIEKTKDYERVKLIDVIVESLSNSDLIKASRELVTQGRIKLDKAYADYYPTLDFTYSYASTRETPSSDEELRYDRYRDRNYKFVLKQNLYNGGNTDYTILSLKKNLDLKTNQYKLVVNKEIQKATKAYFSVVFAYRSIIVNERNMKKLNKVLEITNIKFEGGAISKGDISSIKANVANAETKLLKVKSKFTQALDYYEYVVGENFKKTMPYEKNFNIELSDFESLFKRAEHNNNNLRNYYESIKVEKYKLKALQASQKPVVDFSLKYETILDEQDFETKTNTIEGKITLKYNLYNGGRDQKNLITSYSKIRAFDHNLNEEKRKLKWNLSKLFNSVSSTKQALKSNAQEVINSREMVGSFWEAYELGEQDLQVLLQGQKQLNAAELALVKYESSYMNDFFTILELSGDLFTFFKIDPLNPMFVDFSQSNYVTKIYPSIKKEENKKEENKKENKKEVDPSTKIYTNIKKFEEKVIKNKDKSFAIIIASFPNILSSIEFMKNQKIYDEFLPYDIIEDYKITTNIIYKTFDNEESALKERILVNKKIKDKKIIVKNLNDIKESYLLYVNGLELEAPSEIIVEKVVEKIVEKVVEKIIIKKEKKILPYANNEDFKNTFLNASQQRFTINVGSFRTLKSLENFVKKNKFEKNSFFFSYGGVNAIFKLLYGNYATYEDAKNAYDNLDKTIKDNFLPVIEKIINVKKQYEKYNMKIKNKESVLLFMRTPLLTSRKNV